MFYADRQRSFNAVQISLIGRLCAHVGLRFEELIRQQRGGKRTARPSVERPSVTRLMGMNWMSALLEHPDRKERRPRQTPPHLPARPRTENTEDDTAPASQDHHSIEQFVDIDEILLPADATTQQEPSPTVIGRSANGHQTLETVDETQILQEMPPTETMASKAINDAERTERETEKDPFAALDIDPIRHLRTTRQRRNLTRAGVHVTSQDSESLQEAAQGRKQPLSEPSPAEPLSVEGTTTAPDPSKEHDETRENVSTTEDPSQVSTDAPPDDLQTLFSEITVPLPESFNPVPIEQFPDPRRLPGGEDLLRVLEQGENEVPIVVTMLRSEESKTRYLGVLAFAFLFYPGALPQLAERLFDAAPPVANLARQLLRHYRRCPEFEVIVERLAARLNPDDADLRQVIAITTALHAIDCIPRLIDLLDTPFAQPQAHAALQELSCHALPARVKDWRHWWRMHREFPEEHWYIEALGGKDAALAELALAELEWIAGGKRGFFDLSRRRERRKAQRIWDKWWKERQKRVHVNVM